MRIETTPELVKTVLDLGLLSAPQSDELSRTLAERFPDPADLGRELVARGWLTAFQIGQVTQGGGRALFLGPYLLLERVGAGGMGEVFKATHRRLRRLVALKVMRRSPDDPPTMLARFLREATAAARLSHSNIVAVHDAGEDGDRHYMAMEFLDGIDLGRLVHQTGRLPVPLACEYVRQAALGLHHAHQFGMIHRDVKPQNLMVVPSTGNADVSLDRYVGGTVKVLDLGLVREAVLTPNNPLTVPGVVLGTMDYLSPEQAENPAGVDPRADVYSLGCTLYHLIAGHPPFPGGMPLDKILRHQREVPVPLSRTRGDVPAAVDAVIARLMAKRPEDRYPSAEAAAEALAGLASGSEVTRLLGTMPADGPAGDTAPTVPKGDQLPNTRVVDSTRVRGLGVAIAAAAVSGLAAAAVTWLMMLAPPPSPSGAALADYVPADAAAVIDFDPAALAGLEARVPGLAAWVRARTAPLELAGGRVRLLVPSGATVALVIAPGTLPDLSASGGLYRWPDRGRVAYAASAPPYVLASADADAVRRARDAASSPPGPVEDDRLATMLARAERDADGWAAVCVDRLGAMKPADDEIGQSLLAVSQRTLTLSATVRGGRATVRLTTDDRAGLTKALGELIHNAGDADDIKPGTAATWGVVMELMRKASVRSNNEEITVEFGPGP